MIRIDHVTCDESCRAYGLSEWDVRTIYTRADRRSDFPIGDDVFVVAQSEMGERAFLVVAQEAPPRPPTPTTIRVVLEVPRRIGLRETAIETLAALCDAYGIELGNTGAALLIDHEFRVPVDARAPNLGNALIKDPRGHATVGLLPGVYRVRPGVAHVQFAFQIDETELRKDL